MEKINIKWITGDNPIDLKTLEWAKNFGLEIKQKKVTTSQIRKFYGDVMKINADFEKFQTKVYLLPAKLAYAVGRNRGHDGIKSLYDVVNQSISVIRDEKDFGRFVQIFEAIVAFHKFHGGRD